MSIKESPKPLGAWLAVFAPAYRAMMAGQVLLNLVSAIAVFIELQLLRSLTVVLSRGATPGSCGFGEWAGSGFSILPEPCGASLPLLLLGSYAVTIVLQSAVDMTSFASNNRLTQRARNDVERELLRNLLQQDDSFYLRRSPSEIISRMGGDLARVGSRRPIAIQAVSTVLSVIAIVWVLVVQSWAAALLGIAISVLGLVVAAPLLHRQQDFDRRMTSADEQVKAGFEDTLQGVAEIQVSGLLTSVLRRFGQRQSARDRVAVANADLHSGLTVVQKLTFTIGFIAALSLVVFSGLFGDGRQGATAGLIVLLIATLPQLYYKFGDLTQLYGQYRVAEVSAERLRQYAAPQALPERGEASPHGITLRQVRYRFSGSPTVRGGACGINLSLPATGLVGVVGPAGAGKSTLIRLILGRQRPVDGSIAYPGPGGPDGAFVYLPQRPILFDATLRDNLFVGGGPADAAALAAVGETLAPLGLMDLVLQKGLDALPGVTGWDGDMTAVRAGFQQAAASALGAALHPFGPGHVAPRQTVIESLLCCAVDQDALAVRLTSPMGREPVRAFAMLPTGEPAALAALAVALIRRTAPLLSQAGSPDEYNRIAAVKIEPRIWQLRSSALDMVSNMPAPPPGAPPHGLLLAVALSTGIEELEGADLPPAGPASQAPLAALAEGIAQPLHAGRLNPLLTWRENLLFAAPDLANTRRLDQLDRAILDHLRQSPLHTAVLEAGLEYHVGRLGGRLSGGQQQLVALGRALLSPAPFLVLDEPSSAFHPRLRAELTRVLQAEARTRSVIVVTHDIDLARGCERIVFVRDGAVAGDGAWADLAAGNPEFAAWSMDGEAGR